MSIFMKSILALRTLGISMLLLLGSAVSALAAPGDDVDAIGGSCTGDTLGGMFCRLQESSVAQLITLVLVVCFVTGLFLFYKALTTLMKATDAQSGQQATLSTGLLTLAAATFMVALPSTIMVGLTTVGFGGAWDFGIQDTVGNADGELGTDNFISMMGNFALNAAGPLSTLVMAIAVLVGLILVGSAMIGLANMNNPQGRPQSFGTIATKFGVGIALVNIFLVMEVIGASFGLPSQDTGHFTGITNTAMAYANEANADGMSVQARFNKVLEIAFLALVPFGLIAFVRGLLILKDTTDQGKQASMGMGFTHIVGGVALVNAKPVSCAVMATLTGASGGFCA